MSQDPNQPSSGANDYPYGEQQPRVEPVQNPYPDQNIYDNSQNPYGASQYPYGDPQPYGSAPYGTSGSDPNQGYANNAYMYGSAQQESSPLPLGEALRQLPEQYRRVLTKPSAQTFAIEKGKASWDIVWVQLLGYSIIVAALGFLSNLISPSRFSSLSTTSATRLTPEMLQAINLGSSLGLIFLLPLFFFIGIGILHLLAKAFKGTGSYLQYCYTALLFIVPLGLIGGLLGLVPVLSIFVSLGILVYQIVLYVFATMAVQRLSGGKATAVVLIPYAIAFILLCVGIFALIAVAAAIIRSRGY